MRKLVLSFVLLVLVVPARAAHADVGVGLFLGDPAGLDVKIDLQSRSALDLVLGWNTFRRGRANYGHLTYLYTLVAGRGRSVVVPLRLGIGGAIYGNGDDVNVGVRAPLELGLRFRRAPLEIYFELAVLVTFIDDNDNYNDVDGQGGVGLRFYF